MPVTGPQASHVPRRPVNKRGAARLAAVQALYQMDLAVTRNLAIGNGILTVETEEQAWARARVSEGDKGGGAARACLDVIALRRQFAEAQ